MCELFLSDPVVVQLYLRKDYAGYIREARDINKLLEILNIEEKLMFFDELNNNGAKLNGNKLLEEAEPYEALSNFYDFVDCGADLDKLAGKIFEVADVFHLSDWTVYHYLDQIAEKIGTSREQLLINPVTRYAAPKMGRREDPFDINSFRNKMEEAMTCLLMVKKDLNYIIEVNEKYLQEIERGTI